MRYDIPVEIAGETSACYRVHVLDASRWPGRNQSVALGDMKPCPRRRMRLLTADEIRREPSPRRTRFLS